MINADALLEQYNLKDATKYGNNDSEQQAHSYSTMMLYEIADMIEDAPTAYDTDKVVEQLEEWTFNADVNIGDGTMMNHNLIVSKNAIEIVK